MLRLAAVALVVLSVSNAFAQTLDCATISKGGGDLDANGSLVVIGQAVAGTMSSSEYTIEFGAIPCLATPSQQCAVDAQCDDGEDCTADTCEPGNPEAGGDGCVHEYQQRLFGDITAPFCPPACPQPALDDVLCILDDFGDGPAPDGCGTNDPPDNTDLCPCGGNGIIDVVDVLCMLDAFAQSSPCPHPCP